MLPLPLASARGPWRHFGPRNWDGHLVFVLHPSPANTPGSPRSGGNEVLAPLHADLLWKWLCIVASDSCELGVSATAVGRLLN